MSDFVFTADDANGPDVYASDGTAAGTIDLDMSRFNFSAAPGPLPSIEFDGRTLFLADGGAGEPYGYIYNTDGTVAGTTGSYLAAVIGGALAPAGLWTVNGEVLTSGGTQGGTEGGLWVSTNGVDFTDINAGVGTANITVSDGTGYFSGSTGELGAPVTGLWRTDGTAAGTYEITLPGVTLDPQSIAAAGNGLTAFINQGANGNGTLWVTNGSAAGTVEITNAALGTDLDTRLGMVSAGGKAFFAAIDSAGDYSVWATDGTSAGTVQVFDGEDATGPTRPIVSLAAFGNGVVITSGYGIYVSNGTSGAVNLPLPIVAADNAVPASYVVAGTRLFMAAPSSNGVSYPLYVSDGTVAGTVAVAVPGLASINGPLAAVGNDVVFEGTNTSGKQAFFESDGTVAGSEELTLPAGVAVSASTSIAALPIPGGVVTLPGGNQTYSAAAGVTVQAGSGSDTVTAAAGLVTVLGSSGQLTFFGGTGSSSVIGAGGSATLFGGAGGGVFVGGAAGHNVLVSQGASGSNTTLTGAASGDRIFGSANGTDTLNIGAGRESVLGGGGPTTINGGTASSVIFTGSGTTYVNAGNAGADTVVAGSGTTDVIAQQGDAIFGNSGALLVSGSTSGADSIVGGSGALTVAGRGGNMLVVAGSKTSTIATGNGASLIFTQAGATGVSGGTGSMQVVLGSGISDVEEGTGPSTYDLVNGSAGGFDIVSGFKVGTDHIDLFGYAAAPQVTSTGGNTLLSFSDGTKLTLVGVTGSLGGSLVG